VTDRLRERAAWKPIALLAVVLGAWALVFFT